MVSAHVITPSAFLELGTPLPPGVIYNEYTRYLFLVLMNDTVPDLH